MELKIFESNKNSSREIELDSSVWEQKFSPQLISLYNRYSLFNKRRNLSKTKTKAEVSGGGRKPWRQKGTGRARQGSIRAPQWKGGGIVFGPTGQQNYHLDLNKKVRKQAFRSLLSKKLFEKELVVVDTIPILDYKTKNALLFIDNLGFRNKKVLFVSTQNSITKQMKKSFENISNVSLITTNQLSFIKTISSHFIVFTEVAFREIEGRFVNS